MDHTPEYPRRILDRFAPAKLDLAGGEKKRLAAKFPDPDLEADTCPGGGFRKKQAPALTDKGFMIRLSTGCFELFGKIENFADFSGGESLDGKKMLHGEQWKTGKVKR
jgi:hypothetical protein